MTETIEPMTVQIDQQQLAQELVDQARAEGVELVGQGGLLTRLTKSVLETALEAEMTEHLGYDKHDSMGRNGGNSGNGTRTKTVLTEIGPVDIEVPGTGRAVSRQPLCASASAAWMVSMSEPPRVSYPLPILGRMARCQAGAMTGIPGRRRSGWSVITWVITPPSGRRSRRCPAGWE